MKADGLHISNGYLREQQQFRGSGVESNAGDVVEVVQGTLVDDDIDAETGDISNMLKTRQQFGKRAMSDGFVRRSDPVHAYANEVNTTAKVVSKFAVDVVAVGRERHREPGFAGYALTELGELRVESWLTSAEANPERAMGIKFCEPSRDGIESKLISRLRRVAVRAGQITAVRKRDGDLSRSPRVE